MLGLLSVLPIITCMEKLNRSLQGTDVNVESMLQSVNLVKAEFQRLRSEEEFSRIFKSAEEQITDLGLNPLSNPRRRKLPKRYDQGNASQHEFDSVEALYPCQFFKAIDTAIKYLDDYFASSDLDEYRKLSDLLLNKVEAPIDYLLLISPQYPELEPSLELELNFYRQHHKGNSLEEHRLIFQSMEKGTRKMFPHVERLLRLLLVSPSSACAAEVWFIGV